MNILPEAGKAELLVLSIVMSSLLVPFASAPNVPLSKQNFEVVKEPISFY
mgnify:CR=1 FL=1